MRFLLLLSGAIGVASARAVFEGSNTTTAVEPSFTLVDGVLNDEPVVENAPGANGTIEACRGNVCPEFSACERLSAQLKDKYSYVCKCAPGRWAEAGKCVTEKPKAAVLNKAPAPAPPGFQLTWAEPSRRGPKQCFKEYPGAVVRDASEQFHYRMDEGIHLGELQEPHAKAMCKWLCETDRFCDVAQLLKASSNESSSFVCSLFGRSVNSYFLSTDRVTESVLTDGGAITTTTFVKSSCADSCCVMAGVGLSANATGPFLTGERQLSNGLAKIRAPLSACCGLCRLYRDAVGKAACRSAVYTNAEPKSDGWWDWQRNLGTCTLFGAALPGRSESRPTAADPNVTEEATVWSSDAYCDSKLGACVGHALVDFPDKEEDGGFACPAHPPVGPSLPDAQKAKTPTSDW